MQRHVPPTKQKPVLAQTLTEEGQKSFFRYYYLPFAAICLTSTEASSTFSIITIFITA